MSVLNWMDIKDLDQGSPALDLLAGLNQPQAEAVSHGDGPLLILAGPGSGKTRVITNRIAHLITERGVAPHEILAITFTNKAAREMRERVGKLLAVEGAWISTFHSMCARILRREIEALGTWTRDFSIYDTSDRNQLLKNLIKEAGYDRTRFRPAQVGGWISEWKNRWAVEDDSELSIVGGAGDPDGEAGMDEEVFDKVRRNYEKAMGENNALDFDDLILKVLDLFDGNHGIRDAYARRFRYVMVDEYQDTNRAQYRITRHLASWHENLAVCGDPDQSIYAWRGADIRNILDFERDFGAPRVVRLEQNYRSSPMILGAADALIANNRERKEKGLWTDREGGERLVVLECGDENDEARQITTQITGLMARGESLAGVAIFYRVNFMQRALESALRLARVPYQVVGGVEFYKRREIRDLVSFLRLIVNPVDNIAFLRVVNVPARGVGARSLEVLGGWAADRRLSLLEATRSSEALAAIRGRAKKGLALFADMMERLEEFRAADSAVAVDAVLDEIDVGLWLAQMDDENLADREANLDELRSHAEEYDRLNPEGGLGGFLEEIALVSEVDDLEDDTDKVTLMTLHSAKGLEFPAVFMAGLEEEILPHGRALAEGVDGEEAALEEERRLCYVGMTRAMERLMLSWARTRLHFGETRYQRPSRFLDEIPGEFVEGMDGEGEEAEVLGSYEPGPEAPKLKVGQRVDHEHFGRGTLTQLVGSGINARATVDFVHAGTKQLLVQYANLTIIEVPQR
ncbi:MAG: UvrD-helicase domain-containing protein [Planctomycetota bacterium]|jgi:DNA helicase-2/ATP-dependent DNA helicase PcrA|nr:UvrD-helicase domain-containing protein [Planctomycetota bacterium]